MNNIDFSSLAVDTLSTFSEISDKAAIKLKDGDIDGRNSFASVNTMTGNNSFQNLDKIQRNNREQLVTLCNEPAIARLVIEDNNERQRIIYIARSSNLPLPSGKTFASYKSPLGRLAEVPLGDEAHIIANGKEQTFYVIERSSFRPKKEPQGWDSSKTQYHHVEKGIYSIESLRSLLKSNNLDSADELDRLLEQADVQSGISAGISQEILTAIGLRDQPILDEFQGEIFRLPLDSELIILGPPGTGKTTTLIKRLGQKLDMEFLEPEEKRLVEGSNSRIAHQSNWLMFTPSELLKHYLKEAFSREKVPASDNHIRTWESYRNSIARNTLNLLRTVNGGKFTLKNDLNNLSTGVLEDASLWFESFQAFHVQRLKSQFRDGVIIAVKAAPDSAEGIAKSLKELASTIDSRNLIDVYRDLETVENSYKQALTDSKTITEDLLKKERNLIYNKDNEIFQKLAKYLDTLEQDSEPDDEELFDEDEQTENAPQQGSSIQIAVKAYMAAIRVLARNKYLKRTIPKTSRSALVLKFLTNAVPRDEVLNNIGRHTSFQNGLRRFLNSHKRYVADVATSYQYYRKDKAAQAEFYENEATISKYISSTELDGLILLILKNTRELLQQNFVARATDEPKFSYLTIVSDLFRNQIMVDEATDFSVLQLACMNSLTSLKSKSFFACGDFNQRITSFGIRNLQQLNWISKHISTKSIRLVYRQSRTLNEFAGALLRLQGGDIDALGEVPKESRHVGVSPVLIENGGVEASLEWIVERIKEVEKTVMQLPTIAILVNSEDEVKPMAEKLGRHLEEFNLNVVACEEGKALGEGTDIRVFDIQHIKGLEFEAVFFVGVDKLAKECPELFDRYLYVGTTRAATYLGMVCYEALPKPIQSLRSLFAHNWQP
jgi:superfamily I DNA/RNA helicase